MTNAKPHRIVRRGLAFVEDTILAGVVGLSKSDGSVLRLNETRVGIQAVFSATSRASKLIGTLNALETGQLASAFLAIS